MRTLLMAAILFLLPSCELFAPTNPGEKVSIVWVRKALEETLVQLDRADLDADAEFDTIELTLLTSNVIARAFQLAAGAAPEPDGDR